MKASVQVKLNLIVKFLLGDYHLFYKNHDTQLVRLILKPII